MSSINEVKRKSGRIGYTIRWTVNGASKSLSLDQGYSRQEADQLAAIIDAITLADKHGEPMPRMVTEYMRSVPRELLLKMAAANLTPCRQYEPINYVYRRYISTREKELSKSTLLIWDTCYHRLQQVHNCDEPMDTIDAEIVKKYKDIWLTDYSQATVCSTISRLRTLWSWACAERYASDNPWRAVSKGSDVNHARDYRVPEKYTQRILDACPSQFWRVLFCLWRIGGLRQQEPLELRWRDVDWTHRRLTIQSAKTRRYEGKDVRQIPLVDILYQELEKLRAETPDDEDYIIWQCRRQSFSSGFRKILFTAGIEPWTKLHQNMRSTRENELIEEGFPAHVVGAWMGHTPKVQERHYLQVGDAYYEKACYKSTQD